MLERASVLEDEGGKGVGRKVLEVVEAAPHVDAHPAHVKVAEDVRVGELLAKQLVDRQGRLGGELIRPIEEAKDLQTKIS